MKLINNTGTTSKVGFLVKIDPNNSSAFLYAEPSDISIAGICTQAVPYRQYAEIQTTGEVKVACSGNIQKGAIVRAAKASDHITRGLAIQAKASDVSYIKVGIATESAKGLVGVILSIVSASSAVSGSENTFETVSKNLKNYPYTLHYDIDGNITSIDYNTGSGTITKIFTYTDGVITQIVLSGATPSGISLTKTLTYSGDTLESVAYS